METNRGKGGRGAGSAATVRVATEETTRVARGGCPDELGRSRSRSKCRGQVEAACSRAIAFKGINYRSIKGFSGSS